MNFRVPQTFHGFQHFISFVAPDNFFVSATLRIIKKTNTTNHKKRKNFPVFSTRPRPTHQNESLLICIRCHGQNTNRIEILGCVDLRRETILIRYLLSIKKQYFNRMMFFLADISSKKFKKCSYPVYNSRQVFLVVHLHEQFFELDKFFLSRKS